MRFLEASHVVELLREAGLQGLHTKDIAEMVNCEPSKLSESQR